MNMNENWKMKRCRKVKYSRRALENSEFDGWIRWQLHSFWASIELKFASVSNSTRCVVFVIFRCNHFAIITHLSTWDVKRVELKMANDQLYRNFRFIKCSSLKCSKRGWRKCWFDCHTVKNDTFNHFPTAER